MQISDGLFFCLIQPTVLQFYFVKILTRAVKSSVFMTHRLMYQTAKWQSYQCRNEQSSRWQTLVRKSLVCRFVIGGENACHHNCYRQNEYYEGRTRAHNRWLYIYMLSICMKTVTTSIMNIFSIVLVLLAVTQIRIEGISHCKSFMRYL